MSPDTPPVADDAYDPWGWDDLDPNPDIKHEVHPSVLRGWVKAYRRECFELRATLELIRQDFADKLANGMSDIDVAYRANTGALLTFLLYPEPGRVEQLAAWQRKQAKKQSANPNGDRPHA